MGQCKCEVDREEVKVRLLEQAGKSRHNQPQLQGESMANCAQGCRKVVSDNDSFLLFAALFFRSTFPLLSLLSPIHSVCSVWERRGDGQILCVDCEKDEPPLLVTIWSSIKRRMTISPFEGIFSRSTVRSPPVG